MQVSLEELGAANGFAVTRHEEERGIFEPRVQMTCRAQNGRHYCENVQTKVVTDGTPGDGGRVFNDATFAITSTKDDKGSNVIVALHIWDDAAEQAVRDELSTEAPFMEGVCGKHSMPLPASAAS